MFEQSQKHRRFRYVAIILSTVMCLTGCGTIIAGTPVDIDVADSVATRTGHVTWFDGTQMRETDVSVSKPVELDAMPFEPDLSKIPLDPTTSLKCFQISTTDNVTDLYDMQAKDANGDPLIHVNKIYDGAVYPLGQGWYGVIIPNGYEKPFRLKIGNTLFEVN